MFVEDVKESLLMIQGSGSSSDSRNNSRSGRPWSIACRVPHVLLSLMSPALVHQWIAHRMSM